MSTAGPAVDPPPPPPPFAYLVLKPVAVPFPRIWVGYVVASICFLADLGGWIGGTQAQSAFLLVSLPLSLVGWIYWLFCVHRLHWILCRATASEYPVRARRAVGFQIIPFYSWVWRFKWTNQIARFVNLHSAAPMKANWPGVYLLLGSLMGTLALLAGCTSLRLFVLFSVTLYLTRRIKKVVTCTDALHVERRKQLDMALTAGLGAGFGYLLVRALDEFFSNKSTAEKLQDGFGILLLSFALARFIEPLVEKLRAMAGVEAVHASTHEKRPWLIRSAVVLTLIFSNFFHDLLHTQIERFRDNWQALVVGLLVSGGITYFWISGIRQEPRRAARFGALSGAAIALLAAFILGIALDTSEPATTVNPASAALSEVGVPHPARLPAVPFGDIKSAGTLTWPWALMGLVGGLVIDRRWGGQGVRSVALGILGAALVFAVALLLWAHTGSYHKEEIMKVVADVGAVGGWCLGLLLHPANVAIFGTR